MGATKRLLEKRDEYRSVAWKILMEINAIDTCPYHSDFFYNTYNLDESAIYDLATQKVKGILGENTDYKLFREQIRDILQEAAAGEDDCPLCDKLEKE